MLIEDLIRPGLRGVFCGTALGAASARARAYYAGPGNKFWPTLHEVGFTVRRLAPSEYSRLLDFDLGLTDLCKVRSGSDQEVGPEAFDLDRLIAELHVNRPGWVAFNGKNAAKHALGSKRVDYGPAGCELGGVPVFVLPSTSGAASGSWDVGPWRELAASS